MNYRDQLRAMITSSALTSEQAWMLSEAVLTLNEQTIQLERQTREISGVISTPNKVLADIEHLMGRQ